MGKHKLPSKATMQGRLIALRDKAIQRGDAKSADALSAILDAPIVQEWPEGETTVSYPAEETPKGCGHAGNPADVCSDCSDVPYLAPRDLGCGEDADHRPGTSPDTCSNCTRLITARRRRR